MTVSSSNSRIAYTGNGSTTAFSFPYEFDAGSDLKVYQAGTLKTITTHYTVSGGSGSSGTVTFVTAPTAGQSIVIYDDPPATQLLDYIENDPFPAESHESGLDKLTRLVRRIKDQISRAVRLADTDVSGASTVLPTPAASKLLGWNATANALVNYTATDLVTVATYGAAQYQEFSGDGATTAFTLSSDPGSVNNLDIDISGVSQRNGVDFTLSGTTLTFTSAPASGTNNIHVKWLQALPQSITNANAVNYTLPLTGGTTRTVEARLRDRISVKDFGATGDGVTDDTAAIQAAFTAAYNGGVDAKEVFIPAGVYVVSSTITCKCAIRGEGPVQEGAGTTIKWTGSADKVLYFPIYQQGWTFDTFRIDTSNVSTPCTMMYFGDGLTWGRFSNLCFKGGWTTAGGFWGGTYADHDGIVLVGGSNVSENSFEGIVFLRIRNAFTGTDPSARGDGNNSTFKRIFATCDGWFAKFHGPNNSFEMCETNIESGNHTYVLAGQYAANWVSIVGNYSTAASADGNQIFHADTAGSVNIVAALGGTLEQSNGGGFPGLVKDAGATGGRVLRYLAQGINNFASTVLLVDQLDIGQSSARSQQYFYGESDRLFSAWTPAFTGLTVVLGGGSVAYSGDYTLVGNICFYSVQISPSGGATVESTAGSTRINNMPFTQTGTACNCTASNSGTLASYGVGQGSVGGKNMFMPTWPAVANGIVVSGFFFTDGTT